MGKIKLQSWKYECSCGKIFTIKRESYYPSEQCPKCGSRAHIYSKEPKVIHNRDYSKLTLTQAAVIRGGVTWRDDIRSRKLMPNGKVYRYNHGGRRIA